MDVVVGKLTLKKERRVDGSEVARAYGQRVYNSRMLYRTAQRMEELGAPSLAEAVRAWLPDRPPGFTPSKGAASLVKRLGEKIEAGDSPRDVAYFEVAKFCLDALKES